MRLPPFERLTHPDTLELIAKAQAGDTLARDRLVVINMRLVVKIARRYAKRYGRQDLLDDMIQAAALEGVVPAIEHFDAAKGVRFSTYVGIWVLKAVREILGAGGNVAKLTTRKRHLRLRRTRESLTSQLGRAPTETEILDTASSDGGKKELAKAMRGSGAVEISWDDVVAMADAVRSGERRVTLGPTGVQALTDHGAACEDDIIEAIDTENTCAKIGELALHHLTVKEREVIVRRFGFVGGIEMTRAETAADIGGITVRRVAQLESAALRKLRVAMGAQEMP